MASTRVAIVTGSNKGLGFGIVRGLCKQFDGDVFLTARDPSRGEAAVLQLEAESLKAKFHQLDVTDQSSIDKLAKFMKDKYGGIDVLVNNAGIAFKVASEVPVTVQARETIQTNFWGMANVSKTLFPLLKPGARVVHVSSFNAGKAYKQCSPRIQDRFCACTTVDEVGGMLSNYIEAAEAGDLSEWATSSYGMADVGKSHVTPIHQRIADSTSSDIVVNCCCPGKVQTDMSGQKGDKTIDEGADTPVYLALLPPDTAVKGQFIADRKTFQWKD